MAPSTPHTGRWPRFFALLSLLFLLACGRSASNTDASETLSKQLSQLTLDQVAKLGSYHGKSSLTLTSVSDDERKVVSEEYELLWDSWGRYHYRVKKGKHVPMDVTVWEGKAYQRQLDGRVKVRQNPDEVHYYLRQTWNQWEAAIQPFKQVLVYEYEQALEVEGRPVERYRLVMKPQIDPRPAGENRLRQSVEHDKADGTLILDRSTGVPLEATFHGEYRLVRFSRRPGRPGEEARYTIDFSLERTKIGQIQVQGPPDPLARP